MAKHAKKRTVGHARKKSVPKGLIIGSGITAGVAVLAAVAILLLHNGVLDLAVSAVRSLFDGAGSSSSEPLDPSSGTAPQPDDVSQPEKPYEPVPEIPGNFAHPDEMRGAWLVAGVDYLTAGTDTGDEVKAQIDAAFATLQEWGFNTVILPLTYNGQPLYPSAQQETVTLTAGDGTAFDPLQYIVSSAKAAGLYTYAVFDLHVGDENGLDPTLTADREKLYALAAEVAPLYAFDGFLLENYSYALGKTGSYAAYMEQAPGSGFEAFVQESVEAAVSEVIRAFKAVNNDFFVGLLANAVWAHQRTDERGSATDAVYEEYTDGHADSRAFVESGLVDFVMIKDYYSTDHATANFTNILRWWSALCGEANVPLYVAHAANRAGEDSAGWSSPSQLSLQLLTCRDYGSWKGSAFYTLSALRQNPDGSTDALLKAFDGTLMSEYITDKLEVTNPSGTNYTTVESKLVLQGSADPNFPLTMNGAAIELTELGGFDIPVTLSPGRNTFTFEHKGETVTYVVTYKVTVIKEIAPTENMTVTGGSTLAVSAIIRKGSSAYVSFNGTRYDMASSPLQGDEAGMAEYSDFERYTANITLPGGRVGQTQALGAFTVYASYNGLEESQTGGAVTIEALPQEELPPVDLPGIGDLNPPDPSTGGSVLASGQIVEITNNYAETFNTAPPVEDYSRPTNAYLPKGTTDYLARPYYLGSTTYYQLGSGIRIYAKDARLGGGADFTANTAVVNDVTVGATHTTIQFGFSWRVPYNVQLLPQSYRDTSSSHQPNYTITEQTTEYVDITFYYTTAVSGTPDVSGSPLFSRAEWIQGSGSSYTLRLYLRNKGQFYGYSVVWDADNNLNFAFRYPPNVSGNPSDAPLKGVRICIDPGHGGNSIGAVGYVGGEQILEKVLTLKLSLRLRDKLVALGASVTMSRTGDTNPSMDSRVDMARNNGTDMLISIHVDAGGGSGSSIHYFNEYSYEASKLIWQKMHEVEERRGIGNRAEPYRWNPFQLARCHDTTAFLIECGFIDRAIDLEALIRESYQDELTNAIAAGITQYFQSRPVLAAAQSTSAPLSVPSAEPVVQPAMAASFSLLSRERRRFTVV